MQRIEEIYWLRAYGCLAVFFFHLLDHLERHLDTWALNLARIPTVLGTPIFIFISIFLFSARYGCNIPKGFLSNRIKYVIVPYLVYGLAYAIAEFLRLYSLGEDNGPWATLKEYMLFAGWHGYFLIIAAQFYLIYWLYCRFDMARWVATTPCLVIGSLVSMGWWGYWQWNSHLPPGYLHWVAPLGWLYLFFLALVLVQYYADAKTPRPQWITRLANSFWLIATTGIIILLSLPGWLDYSSKEIWVVPLFLIFTVWMMKHLKGRQAPPLVKRLNEVSFGIYLTHPMFFNLVDVFHAGEQLPTAAYILALTLVGLAGSIGWNIFVNRWRWGGLVFGKRMQIS